MPKVEETHQEDFLEKAFEVCISEKRVREKLGNIYGRTNKNIK